MTVETEAPKVATAVIAVRVRRGEEGAFAAWLTQLNEIVATFPGYVSAVVMPPAPPSQSDWVMVQRFQALEQLRAWLDSDERHALLAKSNSLLVGEGTTPGGSHLHRQPAQRRGARVVAGNMGPPRFRLVATPDAQRFPEERGRGGRADH